MKTGRGEGTDGMLEQFLEQYSNIKAIFDGVDQKYKDEVVNKMNEFQDSLGDAFAQNKDDFECAAIDILNHEAFFKFMASLGFGIEGYE